MHHQRCNRLQHAPVCPRPGAGRTLLGGGLTLHPDRLGCVCDTPGRRAVEAPASVQCWPGVQRCCRRPCCGCHTCMPLMCSNSCQAVVAHKLTCRCATRVPAWPPRGWPWLSCLPKQHVSWQRVCQAWRVHVLAPVPLRLLLLWCKSAACMRGSAELGQWGCVFRPRHALAPQQGGKAPPACWVACSCSSRSALLTAADSCMHACDRI